MSQDASSANTFVASSFDRLAHRRGNTEWLKKALLSDDAAFIGIWKHRAATQGNEPKLAQSCELGSLDDFTPVLLGEHQNKIIFAVDFGDDDNPPERFRHWEFHGLRSIGMMLDAEDAALVAYSQAMIFWLRNHRFCGRCGTATTVREAGHALDCSDPNCLFRSFPRSDPAIIVLASNQDRVLLGRQASWPEGRYSTIAGFVEPGESLETAVRREVMEETGHVADNVQYYSSQPWPFPSSLMLGFFASVGREPVSEPDEELEDIRWFTRDEIRSRSIDGPTLLPPPMSIAFRLIENWYDQSAAEPLASLRENRS